MKAILTLCAALALLLSGPTGYVEPFDPETAWVGDQVQVCLMSAAPSTTVEVHVYCDQPFGTEPWEKLEVPTNELGDGYVWWLAPPTLPASEVLFVPEDATERNYAEVGAVLKVLGLE